MSKAIENYWVEELTFGASTPELEDAFVAAAEDFFERHTDGLELVGPRGVVIYPHVVYVWQGMAHR